MLGIAYLDHLRKAPVKLLFLSSDVWCVFIHGMGLNASGEAPMCAAVRSVSLRSSSVSVAPASSLSKGTTAHCRLHRRKLVAELFAGQAVAVGPTSRNGVANRTRTSYRSLLSEHT